MLIFSLDNTLMNTTAPTQHVTASCQYKGGDWACVIIQSSVNPKLAVNSKRHWPPRERGTCTMISLVSAACSIHSNWEVVVWDGALPGGGGMQDAPWQLWLDVLRWEQDQNHQGEPTSLDRGKQNVVAERQERREQSNRDDFSYKWNSKPPRDWIYPLFSRQNTQPYTTSTYWHYGQGARERRRFKG